MLVFLLCGFVELFMKHLFRGVQYLLIIVIIHFKGTRKTKTTSHKELHELNYVFCGFGGALSNKSNTMTRAFWEM